MNPKYYCPVCHRRVEKPSWTSTVWQEDGTIIKITHYETSSTEPLCDGTCVEPARVPVPQGFYDALSDEDLQI